MLSPNTSQSWTQSPVKIKTNLLIISWAWLIMFTAFQSMANLQSSLNSDKGLGTLSLSTIYVTLVISCLFVPPLLIDRVGLVPTIVCSQFTYLLYIAANIYPKAYVLLPSAVLLGLGNRKRNWQLMSSDFYVRKVFSSHLTLQ